MSLLNNGKNRFSKCCYVAMLRGAQWDIENKTPILLNFFLHHFFRLDNPSARKNLRPHQRKIF